MILLIFGSSFLNKQNNLIKSLKILFKEKATYLMILSSFLIAIGRTIDGFIVRNINPFNYLFYLYDGITFFLFLFLIIKNNLNIVFPLFKKNQNRLLQLE